MSNCRIKYTNDIIKRIKQEIGVGKTSAIELENKSNMILLPIGGRNGDNEKLESSKNTYEWAKKIQTWANNRYDSKVVGNIVEIIPADNGTIINITIPKKLIDAYENKFGQMSDADFQAELDKDEYYSSQDVTQLKSSENNPNQQLNDKLINILKGLGIDIQFLDTLKSKKGDEVIGLWDVINKLIKVSKNEQGEDTLPEEVSHAIIDGLVNDPSVQNLLKQIEKLGYQTILGEETNAYEKQYNNDKTLLIKEAAGKMLAKALINKFQAKTTEENKFYKICQFIFNKIKNLFKNITGETVKSIEKDIIDITGKLAESILNNEIQKLDFDPNTKQAILYQLGNKGKPNFKKEDKFINQIVELKRNISKNEKKLKTLKKSNEADLLLEKTNLMKASLSDYTLNKKEDTLRQSAVYQLQIINTLLENNDKGIKPSVNDIKVAYDTILSLRDVKFGLSKYVASLKLDEDLSPDRLLSELDDIQREYANNIINSNTSEEAIENESSQETDINSFTMAFGTLTNVANHIARTIGKLIKDAQIRVSKKQGALYENIKKNVDELKEYASKNGIKESDIYNIFIQKNKGTTILVREYSEEFYTDLEVAFKKGSQSWRTIAEKTTSGEFIPLNKSKYKNINYDKIHSKGNEVLKKFYDLYKKTMDESMDRLPTHMLNGTGGYYKSGFIANIVRDDLQHVLNAPTYFGKAKQLFRNITGIAVREVNEESFISNIALEKDEIPVQFLKKIASEDKSNDLGEALYKFAAFTISHEELTDVLPKARLLENTLLSKEKLIKSSNPTATVSTEDSNLAKMVKKTIEMQLLGKTKEDQWKIPLQDTVDENGNPVHRYIPGSTIADFALKYNSLLRIGFNPFNAITNVVIGEISTAMEAIGGRYFNTKDLTNATTTFFSEINNKESKTKRFLEIFNPLQELEDYDYAKNVSLKSRIDEKVKSFMYSPQKTGELFLQTRTMIAMLKHKTFDVKGEQVSFWDLLEDNGELKKEYSSLMTKEELDNLITSFSAKIQSVNSKMHGRYSQRDAAIINQNVLFRMMFQFKKWIPSAIEVRLGAKQFDDVTGDIQYGRWRNMGKLLLNYKDTYSRLSSGKMEEYEIYNFKKATTEIVILLATMALYIGFGWDDDEKKKKSAWYKFTMDQLDKVSGDLLFLSNPKNVTKMSKTPFAVTKLADQVLDLGSSIPTLFGLGKSEYERGPNKGRNKTTVGLIGLTPGIKNFNDVYKLFNDQKYIHYNY